MLLYSSDYPHDHGNDALETLLAALTEPEREAVLRGNAAEFFGLGVAAAS
jgi:predicted TIM-barrel fold metal-dependent hydrolase